LRACRGSAAHVIAGARGGRIGGVIAVEDWHEENIAILLTIDEWGCKQKAAILAMSQICSSVAERQWWIGPSRNCRMIQEVY